MGIPNTRTWTRGSSKLECCWFHPTPKPLFIFQNPVQISPQGHLGPLCVPLGLCWVLCGLRNGLSVIASPLPFPSPRGRGKPLVCMLGWRWWGRDRRWVLWAIPSTPDSKMCQGQTQASADGECSFLRDLIGLNGSAETFCSPGVSVVDKDSKFTLSSKAGTEFGQTLSPWKQLILQTNPVVSSSQSLPWSPWQIKPLYSHSYHFNSNCWALGLNNIDNI